MCFSVVENMIPGFRDGFWPVARERPHNPMASTSQRRADRQDPSQRQKVADWVDTAESR